MKAFFSGLAKGMIGCTLVVMLAFLICYMSGMLEWFFPRSQSAAAEVSQIQEVEKRDEAETSGITGEELSETEEETEQFEDMETENSSESIHLMFAGDLYLTEQLQDRYQKQGIDAAVSAELLAELERSELFLLNQEFPFGTTGKAMEDKQYTFRLDPGYVQILHDLHVDGVTLANNHVLDFGQEPLLETLDLLEQEEILHVGAGRDLEEAKACKTVTIQGKTIGFLGASRVIPEYFWNAGKNQPGVFTTYDPALLLEEIGKAKEACDYVIVMVHWGIERNTEPEDYQKRMARQYIDAGADAVIGSHPHVIQGIEYYQGKPIFYSMGNFIFNSRTYETMLAELTIQDGETQVRVIPCRSEACKMELLEDTAAFYENLKRLSPNVEIGEDGSVREKSG